MRIGFTFGPTWSLEVVSVERIVGRLVEAARLAAADLQGNRGRVRELIDDLSYELDACDVTSSLRRPATGTTDK